MDNTGGGGGVDDNKLKLEFDVVLIDVPTCGADEQHWASAGVEYNNSYNVWIGQVSYVCKDTSLVSDTY